MTEETRNPEEQPGVGSPTKDSWVEVGQQFAHLGESIAAAFTSAWKEETTQQYVQQMREGLEKMAGAVAQAVDEAAHSPEGQKFRTEAEKAVDTARDAGKQAMETARPQVLSALEQVNAKLNEMLAKMRESQPAPDAPAAAETTSETLTDPNQVW